MKPNTSDIPDGLRDVDTPALICDLARLRTNISGLAAAAAAGGKALRPHVKTHKCPNIARMQIEAGACGITVAKLGEAETFADEGFEDILIANTIVGAAKLQRLIALSGRVRIAAAVDSVDVLQGMIDAARQANVRLEAMIEVDSGHGRSGIRHSTTAAALAEHAIRSGSITIRGILTHEGHAYRTAPARMAEVATRVSIRMAEIAQAVSSVTGACPVISVGSTPTAQAMLGRPEPTEVRPGNYVFYDASQCALGASPADCALTVLATVIARPSGTEALIDAGVKALASDRHPLYGHGFVLNDPSAFLDWCSEEHGHLHLGLSTFRPGIGDRVRIVPAHACTCANMHPQIMIADGDQIVDVWRLAARDRLT